MDEKIISSLVFFAVLAVAGIGMYIAFTAGAPSEGRTIEGAKAFYETHRPYEAGSLYALAEMIKSGPQTQVPAKQLYNEGGCVLMFNPRSASVVPVPVPRFRASRPAESSSVEMMLDRDWVIVEVTAPMHGRLCPPPDKVPSLYDLMEKFGQ